MLYLWLSSSSKRDPRRLTWIYCGVFFSESSLQSLIFMFTVYILFSFKQIGGKGKQAHFSCSLFPRTRQRLQQYSCCPSQWTTTNYRIPVPSVLMFLANPSIIWCHLSQTEMCAMLSECVWLWWSEGLGWAVTVTKALLLVALQAPNSAGRPKEC